MNNGKSSAGRYVLADQFFLAEEFYYRLYDSEKTGIIHIETSELRVKKVDDEA